MKKNTIGYIAILALLALTSVFSINLFLHERTAHDKLDIHKFPLVIGEWRGTEISQKEYVYQMLETRNLITREYKRGVSDTIYLFIIYSETNRSVFHPPEVCMVGSGVAIVDKQSERVDSEKGIFFTNKLYAEKKDYKELVLYCYKAGNLYTDNFYLQQAYLALHQLFGRNVPGATIRVSSQIRGDEKAVLAQLKEFLRETVRIVDELSKGETKIQRDKETR